MASPSASTSPARSDSPSHALSRASLDSERERNVVSPPTTNGGADADPDSVEELRKELQLVREEKENLASQYRNLLSKLTTMRTTLGNKLQKDAVRGAPRAERGERADGPDRKSSTGASSRSSSSRRRVRSSRRRSRRSRRRS